MATNSEAGAMPLDEARRRVMVERVKELSGREMTGDEAIAWYERYRAEREASASA